MSELKIYKASAGSGKTYTLTKEYLFLLYAEPSNYRQTLAVTFTNKATAEMKHRILEKLFQIASNKSNDYVDDLCSTFKLSETDVRKRARIYLSHLLHDFSNFSVSTIDSFFQRIIRSFAREAGLDSSFKIELNTNKILQKAIDHLLMKVDLPENKKLKEWLILFAEQKLNLGKHWSLKTDLNKLGAELFNEIVQFNNQSIHNLYDDSDTLANYLKSINAIIKDFEDKIKTIGNESCDAIKKIGLEFEDFYYKGAGTSKYFDKLRNLTDITPDKNKRVLTLIDEPTKWGRKDNSAQTASQIDEIYPLLNKNLKQALHIIEQDHEKYITALLIKQNYFALGIINQISEEIKQICRDESLFLIADASNFLNKIIDQNDTPFIYEKIGTHINNYMIDEFQDTSKLQWNNFKPLIEHSLSTANKSLIVGDVKQSIYRWRNSDWNLLNSEIMHDFNYNLNTLDYNYRSAANVIKFNNTIFSHGVIFLQNAFNTVFENKLNTEEPYADDLKQKIINAYSSVHQHIGASNLDSGGNVQVNFIAKKEEENYTEQMLPRLTEAIFNAKENGFDYKDICILVRKKGEGEIVTKSLLSGEYAPNGEPIPVISNESLFLSSSNAIRFIVAQVKYLQNTDNKIIRSEIILLKNLLFNDSNELQQEIGQFLNDSDDQDSWIDTLLTQKQKPLLELVEYLVNQLPTAVKTEQGSFLQAFINCTNQFIADAYPNISAFIEWWDDKGISESVAIPEEQDAIKVMTIHKSKGLEFEVVLLPFCNWPLDAEIKSGTIWCAPKTEPFNNIKLLPLNYTSKLQDSIFKQEYFTELLYQYVDSINMLYVAFTRACKSLITFSNKPTDTAFKKGLNSIADLLYFTINNSSALHTEDDEKVALNEYFDTESIAFNYGELKMQASSHHTESEITTQKLEPFNNRLLEDGEISIKRNGDQYFNTDGTTSKVDYGKIMHSAFEYIQTKEDISFALDKLVFEGKINHTEKQNLTVEIENLLNKAEVSEWFNGANEIKNEVDILAKNSTARPDRVVIAKDKTYVIDYKFGELEDASHTKQVLFYIQQLNKMGYKNVIGYIWYISLDKITEVKNEAIQGSLF